MENPSTKIEIGQYDYWTRPIASDPDEKFRILIKALNDIAKFAHFQSTERYVAKAALILTGEWAE